MNNVEGGNNAYLSTAIACLDLSGIPEAERASTGPIRARKLFEILDNEQIFLEDLPQSPENDKHDIPIALGEEQKITLEKTTLPDSEEPVWLFSAATIESIPALHVLREEADAEAAAAAAATEEKQVDPRLASPRATMRTYLEGMHAWDEGGEVDVLATLDLSGVPRGCAPRNRHRGRRKHPRHSRSFRTRRVPNHSRRHTNCGQGNLHLHARRRHPVQNAQDSS
jgi:hypothetical protein